MKNQLEALVAQMYGSGIYYAEAVREFKRRYILTVLENNHGNQCKAARELGMHRNTLSRTIAELDLDLSQVRAMRRANGRVLEMPSNNSEQPREQAMEKKVAL